MQLDKSKLETLSLEQSFKYIERVLEKKSEGEYLGSNRNTLIISSPSLKITQARSFSLHQGSELAYTEMEDSRPITNWKRSGLEISGKLNEFERDRVSLDLKLSLSRPSEQARVVRSSIDSQLWLKPNEPSYVALLETSVYSDQQANRPLFASIPILGIFFRLESRHESDSKLYIRLLLTKD